MSVYSLVSSLLSYVFITIIYLFIFSVIALIYMDIKKMNKGENDDAEEVMEDDAEEIEEKHTAILRTVKTEKAAACGMKKFYRISGEPVIVGRGKNCDISINDVFLSAEHFQVWCEDGIWYIGDMGSKNGTLLNGTRLKKVKKLSDGDEISFGGLSVIFELK